MSLTENRILIIDDDVSVAESIKGILDDEGYCVDIVGSGEDALAYYEKSPVDIALLDLWLPGIDGLSAMSKIRARYPDAHFVVMSGHGNIETAVRATKLGAYDYIEKPVPMEKLLLTISNLVSLIKLEDENRKLKSSLSQKLDKVQMIGESVPMKTLKSHIDTIASTTSSVLITGENGTGKELVAKLIHLRSKRKDEPFIDVNCAAIPEELIESELFGHEKGSFTGAVSKKRGKFDLANRGTVFLDEIGDMSLKTQSKILRILEEKKFERVGGNAPIKVDVRVIAATNKNLSVEISRNNFREDLYYRLNVIPIHVPALRERDGDISKLVDYYMNLFCVQYGRATKKVSSDVMRALREYSWPGNVRELKNIVERLIIMTPGKVIEKDNLPSEVLINTTRELSPNLPYGSLFTISDFKEARDRFESLYIQSKLDEFKGNVSKTAAAIGIERTSLHRKLKQRKER